MSRTVLCVAESGAIGQDFNCANAGAKPISSQACNDAACPANPTGTAFSVKLSVRVVGDLSTFNMQGFINDMSSMLALPAGAIASVEVDLDKSLANPGYVFMSFSLVAVSDGSGGFVDPIQKAIEIRAFSSQAGRAEAYESLYGLEVVSDKSPTPAGAGVNTAASKQSAFGLFGITTGLFVAWLVHASNLLVFSTL